MHQARQHRQDAASMHVPMRYTFYQRVPREQEGPSELWPSAFPGGVSPVGQVGPPGAIEQLRAIRKQLQARGALLKDIDRAKPLAKASSELVTKLDALEGKLHNPKAQVTSDILAMKGGAQLYSNLGWLYGTVLEGDGPPTQGMREAATRLGTELADRLREFQALIDKDLAELNRQPRSLDLPHIIVPPVKQGP